MAPLRPRVDRTDSSSSMDSLASESSTMCTSVACVQDIKRNTVKTVQFSDVSVRTYSLTVGETYVSKPYPLMLDWSHTTTSTMDIGRFEDRACATRTPLCRTRRGFRVPSTLDAEQRLDRLITVTDRSFGSLYRLEAARLERDNEIPFGMFSSDEGVEEDTSRSTQYQFIDVDDYQLAEV